MVTIACNSTKDTDSAKADVENVRSQDENTEASEMAIDRMTRKFKSFDANRDGKLAKTEVNERFAKYFDEVDADGDGFVTMKEIQESPLSQRDRKNRAK